MEQHDFFRSEESEKAAEIDIDMDDPDVAKATTKIQAGFRGMKARKKVENLKEDEEVCEILIECMEADLAVADIDLEDPDVEKATTMIQAGYRGMLARKDIKAKRAEQKDAPSESDDDEDSSEESESDDNDEGDGEGEEEEESSSGDDSGSEKVDIDLDDPDVAAATTKIQGGTLGGTICTF